MSKPPPHPREYWKAPPSATEGDSDLRLIYEEVGVALSTWESVESAYSTIFSQFMHSSFPSAIRVFGTIVSNSGKRAALNAAAEVEFQRSSVSEEDRKEWELLARHYEEASFRRTEIAHGIVSLVEIEVCPGYFLMPPWHNTKKTDPLGAIKRPPFGQHYRYTAKDISHFSGQFLELYSWGMTFVRKYARQYPQKP